MKTIIPSHKFNRALKRLNKNIHIALKERLDLFDANEFDPKLNNHKLNGKYTDCMSINITSDYRLIYEKTSDNIYHLLTIGSHSELY